jgi:RNA polymerase sigma-70 factor (ECF subfamily)
MNAIASTIPVCNLTQQANAVNVFTTRGSCMKASSREIEDIYRRYGGMVRRRCLSILHNEDDAQDASQEVFIRAMRSIASFRGQASPATWLYRIATNICLNRIRDSKNRDRLDKEALVEPEPHQPVETWSRDFVMQVMIGFDEKIRETMMYAVVEEMTYREISEVMGCSVSLVRKRIVKFNERAPKRAMRLLRAGR